MRDVTQHETLASGFVSPRSALHSAQVLSACHEVIMIVVESMFRARFATSWCSLLPSQWQGNHPVGVSFVCCTALCLLKLRRQVLVVCKSSTHGGLASSVSSAGVELSGIMSRCRRGADVFSRSHIFHRHAGCCVSYVLRNLYGSLHHKLTVRVLASWLFILR